MKPGATVIDVGINRIEAADGKYHGPMESIRIEPANATLEVSLTQGYSAIGVFEDGTEVAITDKVYWQVADEGVAAKAEGFEGGVVSLTGMSTGQIQIDALLGTLERADFDSPKWMEDFKLLMKVLERHVREEEDELMPHAQELLDEAELAAMDAAYVAAKDLVKPN